MSVFDFIKSSFHWGDESSAEQTQREERPQSYSEAGMDAFTSENWEKMDDDEKIESMQQLSDEYSAEIGLSNPPTVVPETGNNYGGYVESSNQVKVNLEKCSNPYEAVDTVIHEDTHAYQAEAINSELLSDSRYSDADLAVLKSQNYSAYANDGLGYDVQSLEMDANSTAFQYVSEHCSYMKDDPAYFQYLSDRDQHFQYVNSSLSDKVDEVNALETAQVNKAYYNGETSVEERELATQTIKDGNTTFRGATNDAGEEAHQACIDNSISRATQLHNEYSEEGTIKKADYQQCIGYMQEGLAQSQEELKTLKAEQNEYISSNNMGFREVAADETCKEYRAKIESCEHDIHQYNFHITELSTDVELSQGTGISTDAPGLSSGLGENAGSSMDNGQSM